MAKVAFTKLNLIKNNEIKILNWQDQKIEIKQYLPVEEKLDLISKIVSDSLDPHVFINPCKIEIFKTVDIIINYTNISLTDKQMENILKIYDLFVSTDIANNILKLIPDTEKEFINKGILDTIHEIYSYKNSFAGIMEQTRNNYQDLDEQITHIENTLSDPEQMGLLKDVITKLD